ncbi:hypothetical protein pb186bvf_003827 [Paramecium bursaria]
MSQLSSKNFKSLVVEENIYRMLSSTQKCINIEFKIFLFVTSKKINNPQSQKIKMIHLVWELYDGHSYREECAEILSNAYLYNNPFVQPLKLNKKNMLQEFLNQLDKKVFRWVFIFFEQELYYSGIKEIVGVNCSGDMLDFQIPKELLQGQNFNLVPSHAQVRTYMRYKTVLPFWEKFPNIKEFEYCYSGSLGIHPKYMGKGVVSYYMMQALLLHMKQLGYKFGVGNAINDIAKRVFANIANDERFIVTLDDMEVLTDNSHPFKDTGLTQTFFIGEINNGVAVCEKIISQRSAKL